MGPWAGIRVRRMWLNLYKVYFLLVGWHEDLADFIFLNATSTNPTFLWEATLHWHPKGKFEHPDTRGNQSQGGPWPKERSPPERHSSCPNSPLFPSTQAPGSAASSSPGISMRALGWGMWTQTLGSFLKLLWVLFAQTVFLKLVSRFWLLIFGFPQCLCCSSKSRS